MYLLTRITTGGVRDPLMVSNYKKTIVNYLKALGFYWSKKHGLYISKEYDNIDYEIEKIEEI